MGFGGTPQNGYPGPGRPHGGILVGCPLVQWLCDTCEPQNLNSQIKVGKHPLSPSAYPRFTDFPYYILHDAIGMTSLICATIPTEESTWGKVKALYSE